MKKNFEFLNTIYSLFKDEPFPFTEYIDTFQERLNVDIKELLDIYSSLLEDGYIKTIRYDRIYLTEKALEAINGVKS